MKNESKTAAAIAKRVPSLAEHQPADVATQDEALKIENPEAGLASNARLDRIERAVADIAERVARIDKRHRFLD